MDVKYVNELLNQNFKEVKFNKDSVKFGQYICDIEFLDQENNKYVLEIDGVYWHGTILQKENI